MKKVGDRGFTLIELLVVMIIIGLLASLIAPTMFHKVGESKQKIAKAQIEMIGTALDTFKLDTGKYPTTDEGLKVLWEKSSNIPNWDGPYLPKPVKEDPWHNPYVYKSPGEHGNYDLLSYGADGKLGGEGENKDITSWE